VSYQKILNICVLSICIPIQSEEFIKDVCVIGAGPAGILSVCKLIDKGNEPEKMAWIDPEFCVGRFGKYYQDIRMASANDYNILYFTTSTYLRSVIDDFVCNCNENRSYAPYIGEVVVALQRVTDHLLCNTEITGIQDSATHIIRNDDHWVVCAGNHHIICKRIIMATGFEPKHLVYDYLQEIPLDYAMTAKSLKPLIEADDKVVVFGNGLSAQLAIKALQELRCNRILRVYPGSQALSMHHGYMSIGATNAQIDEQLHQHNKVIYAIGYQEQVIAHQSKHNITYIQTMGLESISYQVRSRI
jgi:hypothetical protein